MKSRHKLERERREALYEIERLERPKRLKSEREAKLLVAAWNGIHPCGFSLLSGCDFILGAFAPVAANVAPSISDGLIGTLTPRSKA